MTRKELEETKELYYSKKFPNGRKWSVSHDVVNQYLHDTLGKLIRTVENGLEDEPELLPCPFCPDGGNTIVAEVGLDNLTVFAPGCIECGAKIDYSFTSRKEAIAAWNTRASNPINGCGDAHSNDGDTMPVIDNVSFFKIANIGHGVKQEIESVKAQRDACFNMRGPIIEFENIEQAQECLAYWKNLLFLNDWIIRVVLEEPISDNSIGENCITYPKKCSIIRIGAFNEKYNESRTLKYCAEGILVHELLHIIMDVGNVSDLRTIEQIEFECLQHQKLEMMARSLLMAKYGIGKEFFEYEQ